MSPRLDLFAAAPADMKAWLDFSLGLHGLEPSLGELVKIRSSQLNGCANCLHMHFRDALKMGEREERLYLLDAWREAPVYTPRERAALAWTEALTRLADRPALDDLYAELKTHFTEEEQVKLTLLINIINGWNRLAVGFGIQPQIEAPVATA